MGTEVGKFLYLGRRLTTTSIWPTCRPECPVFYIWTYCGQIDRLSFFRPLGWLLAAPAFSSWTDGLLCVLTYRGEGWRMRLLVPVDGLGRRGGCGRLEGPARKCRPAPTPPRIEAKKTRPRPRRASLQKIQWPCTFSAHTRTGEDGYRDVTRSWLVFSLAELQRFHTSLDVPGQMR